MDRKQATDFLILRAEGITLAARGEPELTRRRQSETLPGSSEIDWARLPPLLYVVKRIALAPNDCFTASDLAVATILADMIGPEEHSEHGRMRIVQVCFARLETIGTRAKVSVGTVKRSLKKLCCGERRMFVRSTGGITRGYRHRCNRFELVRSPFEQAGGPPRSEA